ncbi:alpha/beta hydrolase-fold protein [Desulfosporosinus sp. HMP52]|uniref:alpha/beta hydrolase n=1 Tax=Desulfosporosinus sp. HMP52 TaxID=1487923 RepID=UPI00068EBA9C|nr:alpha/beta hydrolase-fold protein [Desulfosporosinus sp. HMP52]
MEIKSKYPWLVALMCVFTVLSIGLIKSPISIIPFESRGSTTPVDILAQNFLPVDMNKEFQAKKPRLIVIEDFHATMLNNNRSLHVYLPPSYYDDKEKKFPVLYVHDGKSVFDISDWSKESLNMHTEADKLISEGKIKEIIIVGIDNIGKHRTSEYSHWDGVDMGEPVLGKGDLYEDFVINDIKPFMDKNFRTLSDRDNTALMGASIGGLATFNIGFRHSEVFSKLAMLSPYLGWGDNKLYDMLSTGVYKDKKPLKIWIDVGSKEDSFVNMAANGVLLLMNNGYKYSDELVAYEAPDGEHSERFWAQRIEPVLLFLFGNIGKPESMKLYVENKIYLSDKAIKHINSVVTYDSGFKMTEVSANYSVEKSDLLKIDGFGGGLLPLAEGVTKITVKSSTGLTAQESIAILK